MSQRPHDWHPLADSDPIPGDPERLEKLGKDLRKTADELEKQVRHVKAASEVESWDSDAGKEFREKAKGARGKLEAALKRYRTAADAIGDRITEYGPDYESNATARPTDYVTDLNRAQKIAEVARREAQEADGRRGAAARGLDALDSDAEARDKNKLEDRRDSAERDLEAARDKLDKAKAIRDDAAKAARDAIDDVISGDSLKDGFWDAFDAVVDFVAGVMDLIAEYAGIAALVVGWIPIVGQGLAGILGAISMLATLVNFVCTVIQVARGDAEWTDLATAAVGFLMMGVGKAFSKVAGKYVASATKRLSKAGNARTAAAARRQAKKMNKLSGTKFKLTRQDVWDSLREPFSEPFTKAPYRDAFKGGYRDSWNTVVARGQGDAVKGFIRSVSLSDPGVAAQLKNVEERVFDFSHVAGANTLAAKANSMSLAGSGVTLGGVYLDEATQ
ncbi:hypothetical protein [Streptomyces physcomitrii]|uniref:WXG100 family type VII secretion target n=1 Tax=Streptomyces physcomitrii TaxID=2724184 RepID=A0ABX1H7L9_9ACTN|nr:hypothetical protein [Streptomyces physcomitrii]NKI44345.1 hypothetical protein [Streptomyces physcomitrii]